jgi:DNA-directed RNA polymerase specialized sigma24 family protein
VLTACLWPGLRRAVRRHAPGLDYEEAVAVAMAGLHEAVMGFPADTDRAPSFVASHLLRIPKRRLRRAVIQERARREPPGADLPADVSAGPDVDLPIAAVLRMAVAAGVIPAQDAWLLWAVDVVGHSIGFAARGLGIGYDAARQRRNRAARRWRAWWFADDGADTTEEAVA